MLSLLLLTRAWAEAGYSNLLVTLVMMFPVSEILEKRLNCKSSGVTDNNSTEFLLGVS